MVALILGSYILPQVIAVIIYVVCVIRGLDKFCWKMVMLIVTLGVMDYIFVYCFSACRCYLMFKERLYRNV